MVSLMGPLSKHEQRRACLPTAMNIIYISTNKCTAVDGGYGLRCTPGPGKIVATIIESRVDMICIQRIRRAEVVERRVRTSRILVPGVLGLKSHILQAVKSVDNWPISFRSP
jgi:hypothetical protein